MLDTYFFLKTHLCICIHFGLFIFSSYEFKNKNNNIVYTIYILVVEKV